MAKGSANPAAKSKPTDAPLYSAPKAELEWGGFIDVRMDDADKESFSTWITNQEPASYWQLFVDCVDQGMKYSLSWDAENETYISTFTAAVHSLSGKRYSLTARAQSWERSLFLLIYKHFFMLKGDWGNFRPRGSYHSEV